LTYSKIVGIYNHRANSSKSELSALKIIIEDSIYRNKFTHSKETINAPKVLSYTSSFSSILQKFR